MILYSLSFCLPSPKRESKQAIAQGTFSRGYAMPRESESQWLTTNLLSFGVTNLDALSHTRAKGLTGLIKNSHPFYSVKRGQSLIMGRSSFESY